MELERVRRHLRVQNKSERVDPAQVQLAFAVTGRLKLREFGRAAIKGSEDNRPRG